MEHLNPAARLNASYLVGAYLAVNAVCDARILVDGPDCARLKAGFIDGSHDLSSALLDSSGLGRVAHTSTDPSVVIGDREARLADVVRRAAADRGCGVLLFSALPFCAMVGADYDRILRSSLRPGSASVLRLASDSLSGDWLDGYADVLAALARAVPLPEVSRDPAKVAIVGYLMDRGEEDHLANLRELRRLMAALGLELVSVWPGGEPYARLSEVARAGTILSMPYGREAASILAERLGVPAIEVGIPFGLQGAERWLRAAAEACGRSTQVQGLIDAELGPVISSLERVVPRLVHRRAALGADPFLLAGLGELADDLGLDVVAAAAFSRPGRGREGFGQVPGLREPLFEPVRADWDRALAAADPDLVVAGSLMLPRRAAASAAVEFGFPSYHDHALIDRPFLGFRGCLGFVERVLNALL